MRIMVQTITQPPMEAAIIMRIIIAECERLELLIAELSEPEDEAAGAWLVSVTESIEAD